MMKMLKTLFGSYPSHNVVLDNFIQALTPGNPGFAITLLTVIITFILGFLVYIYSFVLVNREGHGPYPLWMHTFYLAADFMGIWVFLNAYLNYQHFWFFMLASIGELVWVGMEVYCLYKAVTVEKNELFGPTASLNDALRLIIFEVIIFFTSLNLLRVELGDVSMFKFWIFTQVIICTVPGLYLEQRQSRLGACWQLNIVLVLVAIMSFNPWNMWSLIAPQFFSMANNPWYYVVGLVTLFFAIRGCFQYQKQAPKPTRLANGKRPIF